MQHPLVASLSASTPILVDEPATTHFDISYNEVETFAWAIGGAVAATMHSQRKSAGKGCHSKACAPPPVGRGGSSPSATLSLRYKTAGQLGKGDFYVGDDGSVRRVVGIKRTRKGMLVTYQEYDADGKRKGYTDYDGTRLFNRQELLDKKANVKMSKGPSADRDTPSENYGLKWTPDNDAIPEVMRAKSFRDWESLPTTRISLKDLEATEEFLSSRSIGKVLSGEPLRKGYDPYILITEDGKRYVIDGHHRVAMHAGLDHQNMSAKVLDLRQNPDALKSTFSISWPVMEFDVPCDLHEEFACHSASCRPPTSGGTGGSIAGISVTVKRSTAKGFDIHDASNHKAMVRESVPDEFWNGTMVQDAKKSKLVSSSAQTGDDVQREFANSIRKLYSAIDQFGNADVNPLVHDMIQRSTDWYPAANRLAALRAQEYGVSATTSVAVLAALSPGHDWDSNIQEHEIVFNVVRDNRKVNSAILEPLLKEIFAGQMKSGKTAQQKANTQAKIDDLPDLLKRIDGKNFNDLSSKDRARILKAHAMATGQSMNMKLWEVDDSGNAVANGYRYTLKGEPRGIAFQSERTWANVFDLIDSDRNGLSGTPEYTRQVSVTLGQQAKVRSFFNNIANPDSGNDVTIDTHATSVVAGRRVAQKSPEYKTMAEGSSTDGDGFHGTYVAAAEAYREVAAQRGIAARAAQSQTWVAQKAINDALSGDPKTETLRTLLSNPKKRAKLPPEAVAYFENELRVREAFLQFAEQSGMK